MQLASIFLVVLFIASNIHAANNPTFIFHTDLLDIGLPIFDISLKPSEHDVALDKYLSHPMMQIAFTRYSSLSRPPESRVDRKLYSDFIHKLWADNENQIAHPRMQYILPHYKWGMMHLTTVKADSELVKKQFRIWFNTAVEQLPWQGNFIRASTDPIHIVFLFDPGGSFPWVTESSGVEYIFVDVLQLRGPGDTNRESPPDIDITTGLLVHELFHIVQNDSNKPNNAGQWLIQSAVAEGAACLYGNNVPDSRGQKILPKKPIRFPQAITDEWLREILSAPAQIKPFLTLASEWSKKQPKDEEKLEMLTKGKWVATPGNKLYIGNIYRVGAEMLLKIKGELGEKAFADILSHSNKLPEYWSKLEDMHKQVKSSPVAAP